MTKVIGDLDCQGAVFIYKADQTAAMAWADVEKLHDDHVIRGELHDGKADLLAGLRAWNSHAGYDPDNGFLMIYAHMGRGGIAPTGGSADTEPAQIVRWDELTAALPRGVHTLWLVGCKSEGAVSVWSPTAGPVRGLLLATSESKLWLPLLRLFGDEISIKHIRYYDQMVEHIRKQLPDHGQHVEYRQPTPQGWQLGA